MTPCIFSHSQPSDLFGSESSALRPLCLAYISRLKPTKVFVWQYNNKRQKLRYRVHYATKVFDARTLHDSTKVLVHSDPSVVVVANYEHVARSCG